MSNWVVILMLGVSLFMGFMGLIAFLWGLKNGQFEDKEKGKIFFHFGLTFLSKRKKKAVGRVMFSRTKRTNAPRPLGQRLEG